MYVEGRGTLAKIAMMALTSSPIPTFVVAQVTATEPIKAPNIWAHDNLVAWLAAPPYDAKARGPEERAQMLESLGVKQYAYMVLGPNDVLTYGTEIEAMRRHGISIVACRLNFELDDPAIKTILDISRSHDIHPQLWVIQSKKDWPKPTEKLSPEESYRLQMEFNRQDLRRIPQELRVRQEADRINALVKLAAPYGMTVELYNHNGWFGMTENEVAIIERLRQLGASNLGMIYNFSHARDELHDDSKNFTSRWKEIAPYVVEVNITGMRWDNKFAYPSQGDSELDMMRAIQDSGWTGRIGVIAERGGDAEITLHNYLLGLDWLAAELKRPGAAGPKPFPPAP